VREDNIGQRWEPVEGEKLVRHNRKRSNNSKWKKTGDHLGRKMVRVIRRMS
jgi:hypothetical protein